MNSSRVNSRYFGVSMLAVALGICGACRHSGTATLDSTNIRIAVGSQTDMVYLPTTLAQQLGYYKEEGLGVTIVDTAAGAKSLEALLGGSVDVVTGFYDHAIQMAAQGKSIKAFVSLVRYPGGVAIVAPGQTQNIRRIEDLKRARVGVTSPGSSSHFFLNYLLIRHGLQPSDVSVIATGGGASRVLAIERNKVDAGVLYDPGATQMLHRNPSARVLADTRTREGVEEVYGTSTYPSAVLYSTSEWLNRNPASARRLVRAMLRTLSWIQNHPAEEIMRQMPPSFMGEAPDIYLEALRHAIPMFSPDGIMHPEAAEAVRKVLGVSLEKVRTSQIDLLNTYTNDLVSQANAQQ